MFREFLFNPMQAQQPLTKQEEKKLLHQLDELAEALRLKSKNIERRGFLKLGKLGLAGARRAAQVAELYLDHGGGGISYRLPRILALVAVHPEEEFLPFWERITPSRARPRIQDASAEGRALAAANALIPMIVGGSTKAEAVWLAILPKLKAKDRVRCLYWTLMNLRMKAPDRLPPFFELARRLSRGDDALEVRFGLSIALASMGQEVSCDLPGKVLVFRLSYLGFSCDIELSSASSLYELHLQIQMALRWDNDHMWSFYLCSKKDPVFSWPVDEYSFLHDVPISLFHGSLPDVSDFLPGDPDIEAEESTEEEDLVIELEESTEEDFDHLSEGSLSEVDPDENNPANMLSLGQMSFKVGDKFIYHFDFGDDHLMPLSVVKILNKAEDGVEYPRISGIKGKRPRQYSME